MTTCPSVKKCGLTGFVSLTQFFNRLLHHSILVGLLVGAIRMVKSSISGS